MTQNNFHDSLIARAPVGVSLIHTEGLRSAWVAKMANGTGSVWFDMNDAMSGLLEKQANDWLERKMSSCMPIPNRESDQPTPAQCYNNDW